MLQAPHNIFHMIIKIIDKKLHEISIIFRGKKSSFDNISMYHCLTVYFLVHFFIYKTGGIMIVQDLFYEFMSLYTYIYI